MNNISKQELTKDKKIIRMLKSRVSYLRFFVYIFLVTSVLATCLFLLWIYNPYGIGSQYQFEAYYAEAPQRPVAYLYLSPPRGTYKINEEFTVDVLINTVGSNVVASAAYLSYDKKKIKALSVDIVGSVFDMTAEKEINANEGKIKITLGKPTPGVVTFKGNTVRMATIRFKALESTDPSVNNLYFDFTKGSSLYSTVILDDKKGTNILEATRGAKIFIN